MKLIAMMVLSILLLACQTEHSGLSDVDKEAIEASSKTWVATYNKNDWAALAELFTEDAVMMPPNSNSAIGRPAIAAWQAANENGFRIAFEIQEILGSADIAYVRGSSCVFIPLGNGQYGIDIGKFLEVRQKQANGQWLIKADAFNSDATVGSELSQSCPFSELPST